MIPRNDHLLLGLAVGLLVPLVGYALLLQLTDYFSASAGRPLSFKPRTVALVALCLNILPMNVFRRSYRTRCLRGLVTATVLLALVWFFVYGRALT